MSEGKEEKEARKQKCLDQALLSKRQGIVNDNITNPKVKRIVGQLLLMTGDDMKTAMETVKLCHEAELTQDERESTIEEFVASSAGR